MSHSPDLVPNPMVDGDINANAIDAGSTSTDSQQPTNLVFLSIEQLKQLLADSNKYLFNEFVLH